MRVVAGEAKGRSLVVPRGGETRAATDRVRESLFAILEPEIGEARVLDLFAGSGSLGIEALSRGALHATFVERGAEALAALRTNLKATGFDPRATVVRSEVLRWLRSDAVGGPYDLVLCDPPFADVAVLEATLADPRLRAALAPGALVVARVLRKHAPRLPDDGILERRKEIGEESLLLVRYDAVAS